jgi:hypothetical protein
MPASTCTSRNRNISRQRAHFSVEINNTFLFPEHGYFCARGNRVTVHLHGTFGDNSGTLYLALFQHQTDGSETQVASANYPMNVPNFRASIPLAPASGVSIANTQCRLRIDLIGGGARIFSGSVDLSSP